MSNKQEAPLLPKLRFAGFQEARGWERKYLRDYLAESRISGSTGNLAKKLTVKLWGGGVFAKNEAFQGSVNTKYYRRLSGQFIYSKLDFLNQAFGLIPPHLDGYESTVDLPCFDFSGNLNSAFLLEYVQRKEFYERIGEAADGSRIAKRINAETFLNFPVYLPEIREQQRIAECLSSLDEFIAAQARKVHALKTHKKGLMQQLFPRKGETQPSFRFPEFRKAGAWKIDTLEKLCAARISYGIVQAGSHVPEGMPYIKSSDLSSKLHLNFLSRTSDAIAAKYRRSEVAPGDLVFSLRGNIGASQIVPEAIPVANLTQGTARIRAKGPVDFYLHALQSKPVYEAILLSSKGSTFSEITLCALRGISIPHPEIAEQQRIGDCLSGLDRLITVAAESLENLKVHKRGLMQQLFPSVETLEA